jgi:anti-sigma B factor antagonist
VALDIQIGEKEPQIYNVVLKGEINTETYSVLANQLKNIVPKAKAIVMDMAGVTYISSMGLSTFFRAKIELEERAATIALVNVQPSVQLVFDSTKIMGPQLFASLEQADEYLDKFLDGVQKGKIKPKIRPS